MTRRSSGLPHSTPSSAAGATLAPWLLLIMPFPLSLVLADPGIVPESVPARVHRLMVPPFPFRVLAVQAWHAFWLTRQRAVKVLHTADAAGPLCVSLTRRLSRRPAYPSCHLAAAEAIGLVFERPCRRVLVYCCPAVRQTTDDDARATGWYTPASDHWVPLSRWPGRMNSGFRQYVGPGVVRIGSVLGLAGAYREWVSFKLWPRRGSSGYR